MPRAHFWVAASIALALAGSPATSLAAPTEAAADDAVVNEAVIDGPADEIWRLITTKSGRVETAEELTKRIDEAARFIPLDQLALSPQCGFASGIAGNLLTEEEQWRKLEVMMDVARQVWR